jgi:flagellar assembly factor FliW
MPQLVTTHFGSVDFEPEAVIEFPLGLPAFETETRFLAIEQASTAPVVFLQSLQTPDLVFMTLPAALVVPSYEFAPSAEDLATIGIDPGSPPAPAKILHLVVVTVSEDRRATVNLMAPLLLNWEKRLAIQSLQPWTGYSHQHPLPAPGATPCS